MNSDEKSDGDVLARARRAVDDCDFDYARFLYREALAIDQQNNEAREELHKLNADAQVAAQAANRLKVVFLTLKILFHRALANYNEMIASAEDLFEIVPDSDFAMRSILHAAHSAGYYKLVTFVAEKIISSGCAVEELVMIARAFLNEKIFDQAAKIAKNATEIDPENDEAKDILWKASVEKHMNSNVPLITAGENQRFVPPKVDAEKIFISSHKDEKGGDEKGSKGGDKK
jgi:tetratricopeptide (TPR) repeat protein